MIKNITESIVKILRNTGYTVNAYDTNIDELDSIVYVLTPQRDDKAKVEYSLEITSISKDLAKAMEILDTVKDVLITKGDKTLTENILSVIQNGGGNIYNYGTKTYHLKAFFNIIARSE